MKKQAKSKTVVYELKPTHPLTARQKREIQKLAALPENKIDTSDIPRASRRSMEERSPRQMVSPGQAGRIHSPRCGCTELAQGKGQRLPDEGERPSSGKDAAGNRQISHKQNELVSKNAKSR